MQQPLNLPAPQVAKKLDSDTELAKVIGVSRAWLQKDRVTEQRIPFIRLGDRCLYDREKVLLAIEHYQVGGPNKLRGVRSRGK